MNFRKKHNNSKTIHELGFYTLNNWLKLKHNGRTLKSFFEDNYIKNVAIYGMGELGKRLYEELLELDINVLYAIDKNADNIEISGLKIITTNESFDEVDAIIVTPLHFFCDIEEMLIKKGIKNIVSLEDVVRYCL